MLGLERGTVTLVPYTGEWRRAFETEADRLNSALADRVVAIEHVGSTAIEGVVAKPIVDILVVVEEIDGEESWIPILEELGYTFRPGDPVEDRLFFARGPDHDRTHYLSITERGSATHLEQVAFRDYLRENSELAREYCQLKRDLAERFPEDREAYSERKSPFVERVLEEALDG